MLPESCVHELTSAVLENSDRYNTSGTAQSNAEVVLVVVVVLELVLVLVDVLVDVDVLVVKIGRTLALSK